ncbi:hypothetical protein WN944_026153 [Citrus x changshan-huyou]|uniref:Uncharacterized protein n=1 Tax=Citrus x changshan-huyou TaxID=2935761 RepID=A0AAP0QDN5_9ROSI
MTMIPCSAIRRKSPFAIFFLILKATLRSKQNNQTQRAKQSKAISVVCFLFCSWLLISKNVKLHFHFPLYPKVKVREEKYQYDEHVAVGLQLLESLSLHVPSSPEIEHRDESRAFIARIPKSPLRNVVTSTNSTHKEAEQNNYTKIDEKEKPNIRVTSPTMDSTSLSDDGKNDVKIDEKEKPNIRVTSPTMDSTSLSDDGKNDVKIDEKEKPNIRVTSPTLDSTSLSDDGKNDVKIDEKEKPNIRVTSPTMDSTSLSDDGKNDEMEKPNIRAGSILRPRAVLSSPGKITLLNYVDISLRLHSVISPQRKKLMISNLNMKCSNQICSINRLYMILRAFTMIDHCVHPTQHHTHYNDAVIGNKNRLKGERPAALRNHDMVSNRHAKAKCKASPTHIKSQLNTTSSNNVHENKSDNKGKKGSATADPSQRRYLRTWKF